MIPLYDTKPAGSPAYVTRTIVIVNVLIFLGYMGLRGQELEKLLLYFGLVPVRYTSGEVAQHFNIFEQIIPFFTSLFLHGGLLHLIGNMWSLWIFGDNIEDHFGHWRFLLLYIVFGIMAGGLHIATNLGSAVPTIGASGAIAGVMGAYMILFPRSRVITLIPIFIFIQLVEIPAPVFFILWFLLQLFYGTMSMAAGGSLQNVAWWAHIGGFLAGIAAAYLIGPKKKRRKKKKPFGFNDIEDARFFE